jgi:hypothetical protein
MYYGAHPYEEVMKYRENSAIPTTAITCRYDRISPTRPQLIAIAGRPKGRVPAGGYRTLKAQDAIRLLSFWILKRAIHLTQASTTIQISSFGGVNLLWLACRQQVVKVVNV